MVLEMKVPGDLTERFVGHVSKGKFWKPGRWSEADEMAMRQCDPRRRRWWVHEPLQHALLSEWIVERFSKGETPDICAEILSMGLLGSLALVMREEPRAKSILEKIVAVTPGSKFVPMAASILLAFDPNWRPPVSELNLGGAYLRGARWSSINLSKSVLVMADLTGADLSGANLFDVLADQAKLDQANLSGAELDRAKFRSASFVGANMRGVTAFETVLEKADLKQADLSGSQLKRVEFSRTNLENACFKDCHLNGSTFKLVELSNADFSNAQLGSCVFLGVDMTRSTWTGTSFASGQFVQCNFEGMTLPGADFSHCDLLGSLFTGSSIPCGRFVGAHFKNAGLAHVDWENSDLRNANFAGAVFHLGSSRSGLVGSEIPGEGSKTGFYTDDYQDREFKPSEEIRKASLVGADLRGALVERTDFYMVDLRHARYSPEQATWFVKCGAILVSKNSERSESELDEGE
jgi:uncharacterized protein YjbI with pentapeptide repeats